MVAYADCEPAISDDRLASIEDRVRTRYYPALEDSEFFTARVVNPQGELEIHFQIQTLYPKEPQRSLGIKHGTLARAIGKEWDEEERERSHFVNTGHDLAFSVFATLAKQHVEQLQSIRELITDDIDRKRVSLLN